MHSSDPACSHCRLGAIDVHVRARAIAQQLECIAAGRMRGDKALVLRAGHGGHDACPCGLHGSPDRYLDSMRIVYSALPADWVMVVARSAWAADAVGNWAAEVGSRVQLVGAEKARIPLMRGVKLLVSQTYGRIVL